MTLIAQEGQFLISSERNFTGHQKDLTRNLKFLLKQARKRYAGIEKKGLENKLINVYENYNL